MPGQTDLEVRDEVMKMNEIYNYKMFQYEPEKERKFLKSLKGKKVIVEVERRKTKIRGIVGGIYPDMMSDRLEIKQKRQDVLIPISRINRIFTVDVR